MPIKRQEGEFDILYVADSEPTTKSDTGDAAYTRVGFVQDVGDELSNEAQSVTDRESSTHQSVIYGTQSSGFDITCSVKEESSGGTTEEDPGQIDIRDAALNQNQVWWIIEPEDGSGTTVTGLERAYGRSIVESFNYTRNAGDFKEFQASFTNKDAPTYETT